uniref:Uncharacterized protein n=1 Tax=Octopus bimaculoides TaxID=37653 RepID=A0A0L8HNM0_OCTBM
MCLGICVCDSKICYAYERHLPVNIYIYILFSILLIFVIKLLFDVGNLKKKNLVLDSFLNISEIILAFFNKFFIFVFAVFTMNLIDI